MAYSISLVQITAPSNFGNIVVTCDVAPKKSICAFNFSVCFGSHELIRWHILVNLYNYRSISMMVSAKLCNVEGFITMKGTFRDFQLFSITKNQ